MEIKNYSHDPEKRLAVWTKRWEKYIDNHPTLKPDRYSLEASYLSLIRNKKGSAEMRNGFWTAVKNKEVLLRYLNDLNLYKDDWNNKGSGK
jgi:hypothetical protein